MASLKETLTNEMKNAMRSGDRLRRDTLRMALAAIKQIEVDQRVTLDDKGVLAVLQKEAKKRHELMAEFQGRADGRLVNQVVRRLLSA